MEPSFFISAFPCYNDKASSRFKGNLAWHKESITQQGSPNDLYFSLCKDLALCAFPKRNVAFFSDGRPWVERGGNRLGNWLIVLKEKCHFSERVDGLINQLFAAAFSRSSPVMCVLRSAWELPNARAGTNSGTGKGTLIGSAASCQCGIRRDLGMCLGTRVTGTELLIGYHPCQNAKGHVPGSTTGFLCVFGQVTWPLCDSVPPLYRQ